MYFCFDDVWPLGKNLYFSVSFLSLSLSLSLSHTHTHIHSYVCLCLWVSLSVCLSVQELLVYLRHSSQIIIIIMSCRQHGYPWPSLATSPYHSSLLVGLQGNIPSPHIAAVCMFELVVLLLLGHMRGSIGVHHWWVRPCFSSSVLRVSFV